VSLILGLLIRLGNLTVLPDVPPFTLVNLAVTVLLAPILETLLMRMIFGILPFTKWLPRSLVCAAVLGGAHIYFRGIIGSVAVVVFFIYSAYYFYLVRSKTEIFAFWGTSLLHGSYNSVLLIISNFVE
jgi:hypothetical protein